MILLDTNYLIRGLVEGAEEADRVSQWLRDGHDFCTAAVAWYEFLSGPVDDEGVDIVRTLISDRVIAFTADVAAEAARLWNLTGRIRRTRVDAMIAATAVFAQADIATQNTEDFRLFAEHGARMV